jgi:hypothetical protein
VHTVTGGRRKGACTGSAKRPRSDDKPRVAGGSLGGFWPGSWPLGWQLAAHRPGPPACVLMIRTKCT